MSTDNGADLIQPPVEEPGPITVVRHEHNETAGTYQLVVGIPLLRDGEITGWFDTWDYVWSDSDDRWFDGDDDDRERRPIEDIVAEQREEAKAAIDAQKQAPEAVQVQKLPGAGEPL